MSCIINYKGKKYSETEFQNYVKDNFYEFSNIISNIPEVQDKTSKVKDIVYHGVIKGRPAFKDIIENGFKQTQNNWGNKKNIDKKYKGIFFSDYDTAFGYGAEQENNPNITDPSHPDYLFLHINVVPAILNIEYLDSSQGSNSGIAERFYEVNKHKKNIGMYGLEEGEGVHFNHVVFEPSQIHILGNKQDQEGFKKFVEQPIQKEIKEDKIIFGHPAIGKTFAKKSNDFIDVDEDYKEEHAMQKVLRNHAKNTGKKEDLKAWEDYITTWWDKVKQDAKESGKKIFVSNLPILRMFPQDFDKVITISKDEFVKRAKQRNDYKQGETEEWKSSLDEAISKIDKSKIITTDKYLSDLLTQEQPIVEETKEIPTQEVIDSSKEITKEEKIIIKPENKPEIDITDENNC